ncbi:MAG: oligosaccharide flippase family protein [Solirubrobacteraceae bacterium]
MLSTSAAGPAAVRGGAMRVGGYIVGALASVVSASLLFRHLGVENSGRYGKALALVAIVGALSDLGLTAVGVREMSQRPPAERWPIARDLLGLRITLTLAGSLIVTVFAWLAYSPMLAVGVALACLGLLLQATQDNFTLPLLLDMRLGWITALDLARQLFTVALTVALVLIGATLTPFLGISIPVGAVLIVVAALLVRGTRTLTPTFSPRRWRRFVGTMLPYTFAVAASALYFRLSILLMSGLSDAKQVGYFSVPFRMLEVLTLVPALVVGAAFPIFARAAHDDHERLGYALGRVFEVSVIVGAWVAVSVAIGAPLAIAIVGGHKFAPAVSVLALQGIGLGAMFVSLVWANTLLSLGVFRLILVISISMLLVNAVLVVALVPLYGARGAAIATSLAELIAVVVQATAVLRGRPQLRPSMRVLPYVALASAVGLIPLAMTGIPVIARLVISTVLFTGVVFVTRTFPRELLDIVPWIGTHRRNGPAGRA